MTRETDTLELAQAAAARLGEERVHVTGSGAALETDVDAVERGLAALFQSALRHGGLDSVDVAGGGAANRPPPVPGAPGPGGPGPRPPRPRRAGGRARHPGGRRAGLARQG